MSENNTPDENFGFTPPGADVYSVGVGSYQTSQDYGTAGDPVDLGSADIDVLAVAISLEDPSGIRRAGRAWENLSDQFVESMRALRSAGTTLGAHWESPSASEAFLRQVGRATWSIEDWQSAMGANAGAMNSLATQVETHKTNMASLYADYLLALAEARAQDDVEAADPMARSTGRAVRGGKSAVEHTKDQYSRRARSEVATPLDADYNSAFVAIARGGRWQGPTDAAIPQPPAPAGAPGGPGVLAPAASGGSRPGPPGRARGAAAAAPTAVTGQMLPAPGGLRGVANAPASPGAMPTVASGLPLSPGGLHGAAPQSPGALPTLLAGPGHTPARVDSAQLAGMRRQLEGPGAVPVAPGTAPAALTGRGPAPATPRGAVPARPGVAPAPFTANRAGAPGAPGAPLTGRPTAPGAAAPGHGRPAGPSGGARPGGPAGPGQGLAGRNAPAAPGGRPGGPGGAAPTNGLGGRRAPTGPGRSGGPAPTAPRAADAGFSRPGGGVGGSAAPGGGPSAPGARPAGPGPGVRTSGAELGRGAAQTGPGLGARRAAAAPSGPRGGMPSRLAGRTDPVTAARAGAAINARPSVATKPALMAKTLDGRLGIKPNATRSEITNAVRAAIRDRLAGRAALGAAPSRTAPRPRDRGDEIEDSAFAVLAHYDDEDLFVILSKAPAIIDRIMPRTRVKDPGPAIGVRTC